MHLENCFFFSRLGVDESGDPLQPPPLLAHCNELSTTVDDKWMGNESQGTEKNL